MSRLGFKCASRLGGFIQSRAGARGCRKGDDTLPDPTIPILFHPALNIFSWLGEGYPFPGGDVPAYIAWLEASYHAAIDNAEVVAANKVYHTQIPGSPGAALTLNTTAGHDKILGNLVLEGEQNNIIGMWYGPFGVATYKKSWGRILFRTLAPLVTYAHRWVTQQGDGNTFPYPGGLEEKGAVELRVIPGGPSTAGLTIDAIYDSPKLGELSFTQLSAGAASVELNVDEVLSYIDDLKTDGGISYAPYAFCVVINQSIAKEFVPFEDTTSDWIGYSSFADNYGYNHMPRYSCPANPSGLASHFELAFLV